MITVRSRDSSWFKGFPLASRDFQAGLEAALIAIQDIRYDGKLKFIPIEIHAAILELAGGNDMNSSNNAIRTLALPTHSDGDYK